MFLKGRFENKQKHHVNIIYSDQNIKEWIVYTADKMQERQKPADKSKNFSQNEKKF